MQSGAASDRESRIAVNWSFSVLDEVSHAIRIVSCWFRRSIDDHQAESM